MGTVFPLDTTFQIRIEGALETWTVSSQADLSRRIISANSPLGKTLLEYKQEFTAPSNERVEFEIVSVQIGDQINDLSQSNLRILIQIVADLENNLIETKINHPYLDEMDIQLALEWLPSGYLPLIKQSSYRQSILQNDIARKDYQLGRVLSARAAEKAVIEFYENHGMFVEDISCTQISNPNLLDWKIYDLRVNNTPVDVKNARRSRSNRDSYVEHCVPQIKLVRGSEETVIAGVLSEYLWPEKILAQGLREHSSSASIQFLGETQLSNLYSLKKRF
jgi:hypothetical protein